jgi:hypothetical protein
MTQEEPMNETETPIIEPNIPPAPVDLAARAKEKLERAFRDAAKAGILEALKKISAQVAHASDLSFTACRGTSVQRHPDGQDLIIVVDAHMRAEFDGPVQTGG